MKVVGILFCCVMLHAFGKINGDQEIIAILEESSQHVTTDPLSGPTLKTKDGKKVKCSIHPIYSEEKIASVYEGFDYHTAVPKLKCKFDPQPSAISYSFEHDGEITQSALLCTNKSVYKGDKVKIIIDAFYPSNDV
uniref:Uncharacterized protein n=1 Tax=Panagrolaimus sp. ES5 TaxID=591445 RepID=A0AC34GSB4_9BILA